MKQIKAIQSLEPALPFNQIMNDLTSIFSLLLPTPLLKQKITYDDLKTTLELIKIRTKMLEMLNI